MLCPECGRIAGPIQDGYFCLSCHFAFEGPITTRTTVGQTSPTTLPVVTSVHRAESSWRNEPRSLADY